MDLFRELQTKNKRLNKKKVKLKKTIIMITKIYKACSTDELRENLNYAIVTNDGLLIASNGSILAVFDLEFWSEEKQQIHNAKGKLIHREVLKKLCSKKVKQIIYEKDFIVCFDKDANEMYRLKYGGIRIENSINKYQTDLGELITMPLMETVIPSEYEKKGKFQRIEINSSHLYALEESISYQKNGVQLDFYEELNELRPTKAIKVTPSYKEKRDRSKGIIMPIVQGV